jgi:hypothetical protein
MRKALRKKYDAAIARAPAVGACPNAPNRRILGVVTNLRQLVSASQSRAANRAAAAVTLVAEKTKLADEARTLFFENEDLRMRVATLERQLEGLRIGPAQ